MASLPTHVTLRQLLKRVKSLPKIGAVGEQRFVVEPKHAIDFADQEMPAVLCTPWLIWFLEHAARQAVLPCLEVMAGAAYSNAYLEFLRALVTLRTLNISEESLRDLWHLEKKLLQLIHVDSAGSPTRFLDSCGAATPPERRLLLTNHDLGMVPRRQLAIRESRRGRHQNIMHHD